jgi:hypothetical protein
MSLSPDLERLISVSEDKCVSLKEITCYESGSWSHHTIDFLKEIIEICDILKKKERHSEIYCLIIQGDMKRAVGADLLNL